MKTEGTLASMSKILKVLSLAATVLALVCAAVGEETKGHVKEPHLNGHESPASRSLLEGEGGREGERDLASPFMPFRIPHLGASYQTSHPSDNETLFELWHPSCFGKQARPHLCCKWCH
eukprot:546894-Rhodomonas_salina.1